MSTSQCCDPLVKQWYLYILECKDGTLYTGITDDLQKRLHAHTTGKGAKYTKGRGPFIVRYTLLCSSHSDALKREYAIKRLSRKEKLALCQGHEVKE